MGDRSNGYEAVAQRYIGGRGRDATGVGANIIADWAKGFQPGASVLDLGCGPGMPITQMLVNAGLDVWGVDASPSMLAAFRARFPSAPVECAAVEDSDFFGRTFDGILSWGLMFLLDKAAQRALIPKMARHLKKGGRFVFTAPREVCSWIDVMTKLPSVGLGLDVYRELMETNGVSLTDTDCDGGNNFYYFGEKRL